MKTISSRAMEAGSDEGLGLCIMLAKGDIDKAIWEQKLKPKDNLYIIRWEGESAKSRFVMFRELEE